MIGAFSGPRGRGMSNFSAKHRRLPLQTHCINRRHAVLALGSAAIAFALPPLAFANPFAEQPLHQRARVLRQAALTIPAATPGSPPAVTGADVNVQARGVFGIDWVISGNDTITLMLLSGNQKTQLMSGRQVGGEPLIRFEIEGPETAGHSVNVSPGNYFIAFLNRSSSEVRMLYRASLVPY